MAFTPWNNLTYEQRIEEIRDRRSKGETFAGIAKSLIGSPKNKSTIWSWARRNMASIDLYPKMTRLPSEPYSRFTDIEQWTMYNVISALFPRLDAMTEHLLVEIKQISQDQKEKFTTTAGFLDQLEQRVIQSIQRNITMATSIPRPVVSVGTMPIPPILSSSAPPPPSSTSQSDLQSRGRLRTDYEEMTLEEIAALPHNFLDGLSTTDRNRLQERVKELRMLGKMGAKEREDYLLKKQEEKAQSEASEGLGTSLSGMLDDSASLFSRMRRAADQSEVSGTGTFGKFLVEYKYYYCFSCGSMNRVEGDFISACTACDAGEALLVKDDEKNQFRYWECLSEKAQEPVDPHYTRGAQIAINSRWKTPIGEDFETNKCKEEDVREITPFVLVKENPDQQFAHYLTLFRLYNQLGLQENLQTQFEMLIKIIQQLPDTTSKEHASELTSGILTTLKTTLKWLQSEGEIESVEKNKAIQMLFKNLLLDIKLLKDPESPQELRKASEVGQITGKIDQLLNRFTQILAQLETGILLSPRVNGR